MTRYGECYNFELVLPGAPGAEAKRMPQRLSFWGIEDSAPAPHCKLYHDSFRSRLDRSAAEMLDYRISAVLGANSF